MGSPAQRHFERVSAAKASALVAPGESMAGASRYELMLAKLHTDRVRLKSVQSIERKKEVKREVLPAYADYVTGVLEGGRGGQDDVLTTIMVWRIDAGDFAGALDIARYVLEHGLTLPDQYERQAAVVIAEEFADTAISLLSADGGSFPIDQLAAVNALTESHDMPDQVRAKLCKAHAFALLQLPIGATDGPDRPRYEQALTLMRRAVELDDRVGVKKKITALEKELSVAGSNAGNT